MKTYLLFSTDNNLHRFNVNIAGIFSTELLAIDSIISDILHRLELAEISANEIVATNLKAKDCVKTMYSYAYELVRRINCLSDIEKLGDAYAKVRQGKYPFKLISSINSNELLMQLMQPQYILYAFKDLLKFQIVEFETNEKVDYTIFDERLPSYE